MQSVAVALLEHQSLDEIVAYFETMDLHISIRSDAPVYTPEEMLCLSNVVRRQLRKKDQPTCWAALAARDGRIVARWCGSGMTDEDAIRSAAKRWRVEQIGTQAENDPPD